MTDVIETRPTSARVPLLVSDDASPPSDGMVGLAVDLMEKLGSVGAGLAVALENLFPPIPSEIILPLAGFTASQGEMSLAAAIAWTTVGSVVGALTLYLVGALIGRDRVRAIGERLPFPTRPDTAAACWPCSATWGPEPSEMTFVHFRQLRAIRPNPYPWSVIRRLPKG
nr:hypothetical protein [Phytoactinopolyspora halotolerans]